MIAETYDSIVSAPVGPIPKGHRMIYRQTWGPANRFLTVVYAATRAHQREEDQVSSWWKRVFG